MHNQRDFWQRRPAKGVHAIERRTQIALADTLRLACRAGWWWSHIGHGEARSEATGALLKRMGLKPGVFDMLLISPEGEHHWLELKRGLAPTTDGQDDFAAMCRARGIKYFVARSYEAAVRQLRIWGAL
jgi:hypothetical protein